MGGGPQQPDLTTSTSGLPAEFGAPGWVPTPPRRRLFGKYVALFLAVVAVALIPNGLLEIWFSYRELNTLLVRIQREQAELAAVKIGQFIKEIEGQMAFVTQLPLQAKSDDEWSFDAVRLLRQAPAVTEVSQLDSNGREQYRMSRQAMDVVGSLADFSRDPLFVEALANRVYYGPVYFVRESEPHMTLAVAGARRDHGVLVAQVNLKFIWDVVTQLRVGKRGQAYVVDRQGRLIAHPDISLVLRNTNLSQLAHVQAAQASPSEHPEDSSGAVDLAGRSVLSAYAPVSPLGWLVFAELPAEEAYAPLTDAVIRSATLLLAALVFAGFAGLFLAQRMMVPVRRLHDGAARIGHGDLSERISIRTGDELEALGDQFNQMAIRLQESYATLERKVEERTEQLELANSAKSRFLAAASHDLRQPLHALGLFVAQLHGRTRADERKRIVARIDAALAAMNELFNALLDVSKLDSGAFKPMLSDFPVAKLLRRIETTFAGAAREKELSLRVVPSAAWVRSDFILLERIVFNLVSNAVRYTASGGLVVGCRRRGGALRIEVWDSGPGIAEDEHQHIFNEFYRIGGNERGGLGLGLSIVDRLSRLLDHPIELKSNVGKGSCFAVTVPIADARAESLPAPAARERIGTSAGKLVVVIDDDPMVLESMGGLFRSWGYKVITGTSDGAALAALNGHERVPDVIISDYQLREGKTGIEAIAHLRSALDAQIPAFLMSGDINPEPLQRARANGYALLHKPVDPMALRATLTQVLRQPSVPTPAE